MISHKWRDNKCICGCERRGKGGMTRHSKDDFVTYEVYIECTRPTQDKQQIWREKYHSSKLKKVKYIKDKNIPVYFDMAYVKDLLGVKASIIRYWDDHFNLNIKQNAHLTRFFTSKDIDKLEKIKELRFVKNLQIEQAKEELKKICPIG